MKSYYAYILLAKRTSKKNNGQWLFYTGFTDNPKRRLFEHRNRIKSNYMRINKIAPIGFGYLEQFNNPNSALKREQELKRLSYKNKLELCRL